MRRNQDVDSHLCNSNQSETLGQHENININDEEVDNDLNTQSSSSRNTTACHDLGDELNDSSANEDTGSHNAGHQPNHYATPGMEDRMRRSLKFFFMNPWQKWRARRKFPWKLLLQISKVILVTIQLCVIGSNRSSHVSFLEKSTVAFKHLYLYNWDPTYETLPYPPASGPYAVYTIPDFYECVNYAMMRYYDTEDIAVGTYHFSNPNNTAFPIKMCKTYYKRGQIFAFNQSYDFDAEEIHDCFPILPYKTYNASTSKGNWSLDYNIEDYLNAINKSITFDRIITVELIFDLNTVHLRGLSKVNRPECFSFHVQIVFENTNHNGQMLITLSIDETPLECYGSVRYPDRYRDSLISLVNITFDSIVIIVSILSMILCTRSIFRAQCLRIRTQRFFRNHLNKTLDRSEILEFIDFWYVLIIINDLLTIVGSIYKIQIESWVEMRNQRNDMYEIASMFLGIGNLLVWLGTLRYFGFFRKYNVLILTLKRSFPNILRFVCVAGVIYVAFCFCGWVILGPYHVKFRSLSTTSEALFSLVNGDDMFVTFSILNTFNYVWLFSRVYLYTFISLFIYVVLSIFISVIMDTYETIKHYYEHGFPQNDLMQFIAQCRDDCESPLYRNDSRDEDVDCCSPCSSCWQKVPRIRVHSFSQLSSSSTIDN